MTSLAPVRRLLVAASLAVAAVLRAAAPTAGDILPPHAAGGMDIHHINTGEGSAALLVFPDRTTLLIDCGSNHESARPPRFKAPRRPDESRMPGEWIARYVRKVHPRGADASIDYAVVSHFHADHMAGFSELFRHSVRIATLLDRGWPDYGEPLPYTGGIAARYKAALAEQAKNHGMKIERFRGGAADQIVLRHEAERYRNFEIRHLAVNGEAWTGEGTTMRRRTDANEKNENALCAAMRVRYGSFDYFTAGDLTGAPDKPDVPASRDVESAIAWVTGPVDVAVLSHHGNTDSTSPFFLSVTQPRVCVVQVWDAQHLTPTVLARLRDEKLGPGPRDIFMTNGGWEGRAEHIVRLFGEEAGRKHLEDLKTAVAAQQGHIVVRVAPEGASYHVVVLTDADESLRVRSVHGPYLSR